MIVSHKHRFVFVAVPKTASQSVRLALRPLLGPYDWEQCRLFDQRKFPVEALSRIGHGHISCLQLRPFLAPEMWSGYTKFAFLREPFDRFRSLVRFWYPDADSPGKALEHGKEILLSPELNRHPLVRPQSEFVCDEDGKLLLDMVGYQQTINDDLQRITAHLGLKTEPLPLVNQSKQPLEPMQFDQELEQMILDFYSSDFTLPGITGSGGCAA